MSDRLEIVAIAVTCVLVPMMGVGVSDGYSYVYWTVLLAIGVIWVPVIIDRRGWGRLPWPVAASAGAALILHCVGLAFALYTEFWWDKMTHFASGLVVASIVLLALLSMMHYSSISIPAVWVPVMITIAVVAAEGGWEMLEYAIDTLFSGVKMQHGLQDTANDVLMNVVSGVAAGLAAIWYLRRVPVKDLVEGMKVEGTVAKLRSVILR